MRLADLYDEDEQINSIGYRYYTLEKRPVPYKSPHLSSHPATIRAKAAADSLNECYQRISDSHQLIKEKLVDFKKMTNQAEYADLTACFSVLKTRSGLSVVRMVIKDGTDEPLKLIGESDKIQEEIRVFNEILEACHQFLESREDKLEEMRKKISALRLLAVMQQILDICSVFEGQALENIDIFGTEIRSLLLDIRNSARQVLK